MTAATRRRLLRLAFLVGVCAVSTIRGAIASSHIEVDISESVLDRIASAIRATGRQGEWNWSVQSAHVDVGSAGITLSGILSARRIQKARLMPAPVAGPTALNPAIGQGTGGHGGQRKPMPVTGPGGTDGPELDRLSRRFSTPVDIEVESNALRLRVQDYRVSVSQPGSSTVTLTTDLRSHFDLVIPLPELHFDLGSDVAVRLVAVEVTPMDGYLRARAELSAE